MRKLLCLVHLAVFLTLTDANATDKRKRGLNPRAARVMAEALLKAADRAEALEVEMGCHPDAEKFDEIVKKIHDS